MKIQFSTPEKFDINQRCEKVVLQAETFNDEAFLAFICQAVVDGNGWLIARNGKTGKRRNLKMLTPF